MQSHQPECRLGDATFFDSLSMSQCTVTWKGCRSGPHPPECFQLDMTVECTGNQAGVCLSGSAGLTFTLRQYADIILQSFPKHVADKYAASIRARKLRSHQQAALQHHQTVGALQCP